MNETKHDANHNREPGQKEHHPWWTRPHKDWRFWAVVFCMLAAMIIYVMSDDLALRPRNQPQQPQSGISGQ